jgi:hypothetical protein
MGTHALVHFISQRRSGSSILVSFYFQYDGYLAGVGKQLLDFLKSRRMVNGIPLRREKDNFIYANGLECLAAQFCAEFKRGPGNLYIVPSNHSEEEHTYNVMYNEEVKEIYVGYLHRSIMTLDEFEAYIDSKSSASASASASSEDDK